jgi:hypothetical protein
MGGYRFVLFDRQGGLIDSLMMQAASEAAAIASVSRMRRDFTADMWREGQCFVSLPVAANDVAGDWTATLSAGEPAEATANRPAN